MADLNGAARLTFLGGAGTVTGSKILVEYKDKKILIDCGLFQGLKQLRLLNRAPFPIDPSTIDTIVLTHAHLDHCGFLPVLVNNGFKGDIHCTYPTKDLTEVILMDSAKIQEEDAARANSHKYSKHPESKPLYTTKDVIRTMKHLEGHDLHEWVIIDENISFQFKNAGHILGSSFVELKIREKKFLFSGDIGRTNPMLLYPPKRIEQADYVVLESTYGDRIHPKTNVKMELLSVIEDTFDKKGILMIPSFAVERTQEIIYLLYQLIEEEMLPPMKIYLDSPMGVNSTNIYNKYHDWQNISNFEINRMYNDIHYIMSYEESKAMVQDSNPKIIIAGSGMVEGGRILHYLNNHLENERNTLLFVGYQGEGTRGRSLMDGAKEIKFFGEYRKVRCEIRSISSLSAHGDQEEMLNWLKGFKTPPTTLFLNHGEPHQADTFRVKIESELGWDIEVPSMNS
ncbi:MAG: MBL fold metallo-hydrolase, partial [Bacteroidetes bacterium]